MDPDPGPTFYFDADLDTAPTINMFGKSEFSSSVHSNASLHCFIFLISFKGVIIFSVSDRIFEFLWDRMQMQIWIRSRINKPWMLITIRFRLDPDPDPQHCLLLYEMVNNRNTKQEAFSNQFSYRDEILEWLKLNHLTAWVQSQHLRQCGI